MGGRPYPPSCAGEGSPEDACREEPAKITILSSSPPHLHHPLQPTITGSEVSHTIALDHRNKLTVVGGDIYPATVVKSV